MTNKEETKNTATPTTDEIRDGEVKKPMPLAGGVHRWQICFDCEQTGIVGDDECNMCAGSGWIPI